MPGSLWFCAVCRCSAVLDVHKHVWLWFISLTFCSWPELWCSFLSCRPVVWRLSQVSWWWGGCQVQKLLFPCVTGALLVLTRSLSHLACPQTQSVPPAPSLLALCPQSDIRKAEYLPQKLSCAGPQGPALPVCAKLLQTPVVSELVFRDCWGLSWCGWQHVLTGFASKTGPGANYHAWEYQRSGTKD